MEDTVEQPNISHKENPASHLAPWQFKKGQSGNLKGRTPGKSLKEFAKEYLSTLTEEERIEYFEGMNKKDVWAMAEGNPDNKTDLTTKGDKINVLDPKIVEATKKYEEEIKATLNVPTEPS